MFFLKDIISNRRLVFDLAKNDFKIKYSGSYLGAFWAFVQPLVTIIVFWFVFQIGLRVTPIDEGVPFSLWFISGLIPWFFFSDAVSNATNCYQEYSYLVKKVVFKISLLPLVKIISSMFIHVIFMVFLIVTFYLYGFNIALSTVLGMIYFSLCTFLLSYSLSLITSSIVVFFKDTAQIISIVLQIGMWMTPIMWSTKLIPDSLKWIFEINPMFYVVNGYRSSLIYQEFSNDFFVKSLLFWIGLIFTFLIGFYTFKKSKGHFADLL